jgi:hypothetical protein
MLTAAREYANPNDFALVAMLGRLGLRIFEATGTPSTAPWTAEIPGRSCATPAGRGWTATPRPAGCATSQRQAGVRLPRMHPHMLRHTFVATMLDAGVDLRDVQIAARHADPRTTMRYDRGADEPRPPPQRHSRCLHGLGHLSRLAGRT